MKHRFRDTQAREASWPTQFLDEKMKRMDTPNHNADIQKGKGIVAFKNGTDMPNEKNTKQKEEENLKYKAPTRWEKLKDEDTTNWDNLNHANQDEPDTRWSKIHS